MLEELEAVELDVRVQLWWWGEVGAELRPGSWRAEEGERKVVQ